MYDTQNVSIEGVTHAPGGGMKSFHVTFVHTNACHCGCVIRTVAVLN